jgi:hypothetical protein
METLLKDLKEAKLKEKIKQWLGIPLKKIMFISMKEYSL